MYTCVSSDLWAEFWASESRCSRTSSQDRILAPSLHRSSPPQHNTHSTWRTWEEEKRGREKQNVKGLKDTDLVIAVHLQLSLCDTHTRVHTRTHTELLVREVAQSHPSTQLWCPLCRTAGKLPHEYFYHTGQILPTHTLTTGTQLPLL